jgi:hypothetical protein
MFRWLILAALACSRSPSPAPHSATEQKQVASSSDEFRGRRATEADSKHRFPVLESRPTEPAGPGVNRGLVGTEPRKKLSLPDFAASNRDGKTRSKADLQGQPTVVWFFPAAGTPG